MKHSEEQFEHSARTMAEEISARLDFEIPVQWRPWTSSTNLDAKEAALAGAPAPSVYGAEMQYAGRGRLNRQWETGAGEAVEMSFLFRPDTQLRILAGFNFAAALGICTALRASYRLPAAIKWPNDVTVEGRKICGILSESSSIGAQVSFVVTGTGINVNQTTFPPELEATATSMALLMGRQLSRAEVAARCIEQVVACAQRFEHGGFEAIMEEYEAWSSVLHKNVRVLSDQGELEGICEGFGETGSILVRINGRMQAFNANDVSVRGN